MMGFSLINLSNFLILICASCMFGVAFFLIWQAPRIRLNQLMTIWVIFGGVSLLLQLTGAQYTQFGLDNQTFAKNITTLWFICAELGICLLVTSLILYTKPWTEKVRQRLIGFANGLLPLVVGLTIYDAQHEWYEASFDQISGVPLLAADMMLVVTGEAGGALLAVSAIIIVAYTMSLVVLLPFIVAQKETSKYLQWGTAGVLIATVVVQMPFFLPSGLVALVVIVPDLLIVYAIMDDQVFAPIKRMTEELKESKNSLEIAYRTVEREVNQQTKELIASLGREQELSQRLEASLEKEEQLSQLKSLIIDNVFHEFRTPLTIINNAAEMLNRFGDRLDDEKRNKYFGRINDQIFYIDDLLNDILLASRANSEGIRPQFQLMPFNTLCAETVILWQSDFAHDGLLTFEFDPQDDRPVLVDRRLIEQIGLNLLSNAIKYSNPHPIVTVSFILGQHITVQFIDNGIGVLTEDQERIFELFERGQNIETRRGMGLGLYTAQQMAKAMDGEIVVESAGANQGSIFTVVVPLSQEVMDAPPLIESKH